MFSNFTIHVGACGTMFTFGIFIRTIMFKHMPL